MALIIARSTRQGTRAGVAAALGIAAGAGVHIAAAAVGGSAIITTSAWAFTTLKWLGALYLGYIGVRMLWDSFASHAPSPPRRILKGTNFRGILLQGFLTNALNPKVALFFLALLPQFIDAGAPSKAAAFVLLGLVFDTTGTIFNLAIAWLFKKFSASAWCTAPGLRSTARSEGCSSRWSSSWRSPRRDERGTGALLVAPCSWTCKASFTRHLLGARGWRPGA